MKVLVTGGTGFIGSTLVRHLLAAGHQVRALVRQSKDSFLLGNLDVEPVNGDITSVPAIEKAMPGCEVVFNLASLYAFYPFWIKDPKAIYRINVDGTRNMLEAALKYGVKKFIHTSTIATISARADGKPSDETTGFECGGASHYARSKYLAEQEVLGYFQRGLPAVILNPGVVIGERDHKPTPSGDVIVKFLNRSYPGYFDALWSVADADDVARAHLAAVERGRPGERYILCGREHYTLKDIFGLLEKITGIPAPRVKIPYAGLLGFTCLEEAFSHFLFRKKPLMPTEGVKFSHMSIVYDNSKAVRELGYASTPFAETLSKAVAWYRKNAYVEPRGAFRIKAHGPQFARGIMRRLGMDAFTDKLNAGTAFFFLVVKALGLLHKAGLGKGTDGWRKVTQCYLRTEQSKFGLAVFGLDLWSDAQGFPEMTLESARKHCVDRLARFLRSQPFFHYRLEWSSFCARRIPQKVFDIVEADFDKDGKIVRLAPRLENAGGIGDLPWNVQELLVRGVIESYNATKDLCDKKRPLALRNAWRHWLSDRRGSVPDRFRRLAEDFGERVLEAAFIRFETMPEGVDARFQAPSFLKAKHPGFGFLNIAARLTPDRDEADLWIQFSHVPQDGVPAQEILNKLKAEWGIRGGLLFPDPGSHAGLTPEACSSGPGNEAVFHAFQFLDFRPFLKLRSRLNARFGGRAKQVVSSAALLIWKLAQYREFEDVKFAVPVDLRATAERERTLGFIFIRPSVYFDRHRPDRGFFGFQQEFNRQLFAVRKRKSESYQLLESYTAAAPAFYAATTKFLLRPLQDFVGSVGITIIKKADFFVAPASDVHTDGFIAFSNFTQPSRNAGEVGAVSVKGPAGKVRGYLNVLQDVMHRAVQYDELYF